MHVDFRSQKGESLGSHDLEAQFIGTKREISCSPNRYGSKAMLSWPVCK